MSRSSLRLILGVFAGGAISLSAPAATFAHGHAHEHLLEHVAESHGAIVTQPVEAEVHAPEQHEDHAHGAIDPGMSSRCASGALSALMAPRVNVSAWVWITRELAAPHPNESPPDPHEATLTQPRAPPVLLTI